MQSLKKTVEVKTIDNASVSSTEDTSSCGSESQAQFKLPIIPERNYVSYADKLKELDERSIKQNRLEERIQRMRKRWSGELPSLKVKDDQILADDELLVDYSNVVQQNAADAHEKITKTIQEALALIRRWYEALDQFDNHMLEILKREE